MLVRTRHVNLKKKKKKSKQYSYYHKKLMLKRCIMYVCFHKFNPYNIYNTRFYKS